MVSGKTSEQKEKKVELEEFFWGIEYLGIFPKLFLWGINHCN